jgi:hypothetical protein
MGINLKKIRRSIAHKDEIKEARRIKNHEIMKFFLQKYQSLKLIIEELLFLLINSILYKNKLFLKKNHLK